MTYRTITIAWLPKSTATWRTFSAVRAEAANVWNWLVELHADIRCRRDTWPSKADLQVQAKGRFPNLHSQSAQQTIADFCEAIASTAALRRNGHTDAKYPFKTPKYRCVIFTNQSVRLRDGFLTLPCLSAGKLRVKIPPTVTLPGRLIEVRLHYGKVELICKINEEAHQSGSTIGVDLGVNTLIAATDGEKAVCVSGRAVKAVTRLRNKRLAEIQAKQATKTKGSRRWKRLQRTKYKSLDKAKRQIKDICHKATRKVADAFPHAKAYVGEPFNDAAQKIGRVQAQLVSQACNAVIIAMLGYKLAAAIRIPEFYSSQTCPVCGERNKCGRAYRCKSCKTAAPRDVIGCVNNRSLGVDGQMVPGRSVPNATEWVHPIKYAGPKPASRADTTQVARRKPRKCRTSVQHVSLVTFFK